MPWGMFPRRATFDVGSTGFWAARRRVSWEAAGAIGEIVGALGVILTLAYLAVQIRQNTDSLRAATLQSMSEASASYNDLLAANAELANIVLTGASDLEALSPADNARFVFAMMALLRRGEHIHRETKRNRLDGEDWAGIRNSTLFLMSQPGCRAWWNENARLFSRDFAAWMDGELAKLDPDPGAAAPLR